MDEGDEYGLDISTGLIRHPDGTFGVRARVSVSGRPDVEPVESVLETRVAGPLAFPPSAKPSLRPLTGLRTCAANATNTPPRVQLECLAPSNAPTNLLTLIRQRNELACGGRLPVTAGAGSGRWR